MQHSLLPCVDSLGTGDFYEILPIFQTRIFSSGGGLRQVEKSGDNDSAIVVDRQSTAIRDHDKVHSSWRSLDRQPHGSRSISPASMKPSHPVGFFNMSPRSILSSPSSTASVYSHADTKLGFRIVIPRDIVCRFRQQGLPCGS